MTSAPNSHWDPSWSQIARWRSECFQRYGPIQQMPMVESPARELIKLLRADSRVLDLGAGVDQPLRRLVAAPERRYFTLDVDPRGTFDFRTIGDIPDALEFDIAVADQLFEHLTIRDAFETLYGTFQHLAVGGYFLADVPNAAHPVRQWGDATHITAWPIFDFYGLFREVGFSNVGVARYNKYPLTRHPLKRWIVQTVCDAFRIDWCDSILIIACKADRGGEGPHEQVQGPG